MRMKRWLLIAMIALVGGSAIAPVYATDRQGYAGVGVGNADLDRSGFDDDTAYKIFGGWQMNKNFAIEGAYIDLGDFKSNTSKVSENGFQATAVGMAPLGEAFRVFGKAGLFSNGGTDLTYGVGFEWGRKIGVRAEWEVFTDISGSSDVNMISVSAVFNFGTRR